MEAGGAQPLDAARGPRPEASRRAFRVGLAMAIASTVIGALQPVVTRFGATHIDPLLFCAAAMMVAAACVVPVLHWRGELGVLFDRRHLPRLFALSMAGSVATSLTLTFGLRRVSAITGVLLLQAEPIYSLVLTAVVIGERPSMRQLLSTAIVLTGICSVFGASGAFTMSWAALLILLTPLFWQTAHVLSLPVMPPLTAYGITGARYFYAAGLMALLVALFDRPALAQLADPVALRTILVTGFLIFFIASLTWYAAIERLSLAWTTALVVPGVPLLSILFAVGFLGEHASARQTVGILIAIAGVLALVLGADPHRGRNPRETAEAIHSPLD